MKTFSITINGKKIEAGEGQTILEAAREKGIDIPSLCQHPDLEPKASCRLCVVQINRVCQDNPFQKPCIETACTTKVQPGMEIRTDSPTLEALRKTNLELLFAQHREECFDCVWNFNCQLLKLAKKYGAGINRFKDRKTNFPVYQFGPALIYDSSKCIDCGNCVEMCQKQEVNYLELKENSGFSQVTPSQHRDCIFCGQCIVHCPAGAFEAVGEFESASVPIGAMADKGNEKPFKIKGKTVVVQFAPTVGTSIGEEFGLKPGKIVTGQVVAGIRKLGANKIFDVSVGADFTATEEAGELLEKLKTGKQFTMFSSCCPAWVRFVELYYPEFVSNLATARPPHIILGGLIKTYLAEKEKIDPENIVVVSVMPCVAKKYEITRKEFIIDGVKPVDYVLTTRELAYLFIKHKIDLKKIKPEKADDPFGIPSGAGVIYEASGGVMEAALRNVVSQIYTDRVGVKLYTDPIGVKTEFRKTRGQEGIKIVKIKIADRNLKLAVVNGTGNAKKILEEIKQNPFAYDYVEVMACPGGCVGGGGQPVPTDGKLRQKRAEGLYKIDEKQKVRTATENPIVKKVYREFLSNEEIREKMCHTFYKSSKP